MATCFGPICIMWQPPDSVPDEPPPSHAFFIGFRDRNAVQNHWLDGKQPATVLLYVPVRIETFAVEGDELLTSENSEFANLSRLLSLVGVHSFYLASVVQVIHSNAVAMAYETTDNGHNVIAMVAEIPFRWFCPPQEVRQNQEEDDENEDEDEDDDEDEDEDDADEFEDGENETMDEVVSYSLEDGMDVDVDMVIPATKASIEALEKLEGLNSMGKCMICLEQLSLEDEVCRMPCSHVYHADCIIQWLKKSHMCPLCRFKMPVDPS